MSWPRVRLGDVLRQSDQPVRVVPDQHYPIAGIYGYGRGLFARTPIRGKDTSYSHLNRLREGLFVLSRVKAWEGAVGVVPPQLAGHFVSKEFPSFEGDRRLLNVRWLKYFFDSEVGRRALVGCTKGIGARRERVKEAAFLDIEVSLPDINRQHAIVTRLDALASESEVATGLRVRVEEDLSSLLSATYRLVADEAPRRRMADVAPLVRREVPIDVSGTYPELGVRSFGRGTFHKPPLAGADVGTKRLFKVFPGDLVFNIVFAWEGAVAVAKPEDAERVGSHRFLTCVPSPDQALAKFLCFHFLTKEGYAALGDASPGGAGRNRTLGLQALAGIEVPLPSLERQRWFTSIYDEVERARRLQQQAGDEHAELIRSVVGRVFSPEHTVPGGAAGTAV